jgi:hypothetical protein
VEQDLEATSGRTHTDSKQQAAVVGKLLLLGHLTASAQHPSHARRVAILQSGSSEQQQHKQQLMEGEVLTLCLNTLSG